MQEIIYPGASQFIDLNSHFQNFSYDCCYRQNLTGTQEHLDVVDHELDVTTQKIYDANLALADLRKRANDLTRDAQNLKSNATAIQEANVEGMASN